MTGPGLGEAVAGILVLGLGNILTSDEGVGVRMVERLVDRFEIPAGVEIVDGGTCGMELLDQLAGREVLIVADAMRADAAPGTVIRLADEDYRARFRTRVSPHQLGLAEVLASLTLSDEEPRHIVIIGVVPESLELGLELTATADKGCEAGVEALAAELAALGVKVRKKAA